MSSASSCYSSTACSAPSPAWSAPAAGCVAQLGHQPLGDRTSPGTRRGSMSSPPSCSRLCSSPGVGLAASIDVLRRKPLRDAAGGVVLSFPFVESAKGVAEES